MPLDLSKPLPPELLHLPRERDPRPWLMLMLARTPEAWSQLLQGKPVPADQLDPEFLARMRSRRAL